MEKIFSNPGFHHIAEKICWNLDIKSLQNLSKASEITKSICDYILAWLKKNLKIKFNHSKIMIFAEEKRKLRKLAVLVKTNMEQMILKHSGTRFGLKLQSSNPLDCLVILDQANLVRIFNSPTQMHLEYAIYNGRKHMAMVLFEQMSVQEKIFTPSVIKATIMCDNDKTFAFEMVGLLVPMFENPITEDTLTSAVVLGQFKIIKTLLPLCNYQRDKKYVEAALKIAEYHRRTIVFHELDDIIELFRKFLSIQQ